MEDSYGATCKLPVGVLTVATIFLTRQTPRPGPVQVVPGVTWKSSSLHRRDTYCTVPDAM